VWYVAETLFEIMMSRFQIPKPKTVAFAVRAFYIGWLLSVPLMLMGAPSEKSETDPEMIAVMGMILVIPMVICLVFIPIWLFQNISSGKNWARIVWLVLVVLNLPGALVGTIETFNSSSVLSGLLGLTQWLLFLASCILLYVPSSTPWFKSPFYDAAASSGLENELMPGIKADESEFVPLDVEAVIEEAKMRRQARDR
jgi:hypothetical protein